MKSMKIKIFSILMILIYSSSSTNLYAYDEGSIGQTIICKGKLTRVFINKEKTPVEEVTVYVKKIVDGIYNIELAEFQKGRMPGKIKVVANNVVLKEDGSFNIPNMKGIICLKIAKENKYNANFRGILKSGQKLKFTLESVDANFFGVPIKVIIDFEED